MVGVLFVDFLFAQPPVQNVAEPPQFNAYNGTNMKFLSGMLTTIGRSYSNSIDKGVMSSWLIMDGASKDDLRKTLGINDAQAKEIETFRNTLQVQTLANIPNLIKRFSNATEDDLKSIQTDIENYIQEFVTKIDSIVTPEQQAKAKELVFQMTGGLESPLLGKDALDVLDLTEEQRKKAEQVIEQTRIDRNEKFEEIMKLVDARVEKGKDITQEERIEIRKKGEQLMAEINAIGKKAGSQLKSFLDKQQLKKSDDLLANIPEFLPKLQLANNNAVPPYIPGINSWKPGQGVPDNKKNREKNVKTFPRNKSE
jgi:hypothetical protein